MCSRLAIFSLMFAVPLMAQTAAPDLRGVYIYTNDVSTLSKSNAAALTQSLSVPGSTAWRWRLDGTPSNLPWGNIVLQFSINGSQRRLLWKEDRPGDSRRGVDTRMALPDGARWRGGYRVEFHRFTARRGDGRLQNGEYRGATRCHAWHGAGGSERKRRRQCVRGRHRAGAVAIFLCVRWHARRGCSPQRKLYRPGDVVPRVHDTGQTG